jgi:hypothetical protein
VVPPEVLAGGFARLLHSEPFPNGAPARRRPQLRSRLVHRHSEEKRRAELDPLTILFTMHLCAPLTCPACVGRAREGRFSGGRSYHDIKRCRRRRTSTRWDMWHLVRRPLLMSGVCVITEVGDGCLLVGGRLYAQTLKGFSRTPNI